MGMLSVWQWGIVLVIAIILFGGKGKLSSILGDLGKGLKDFKKNISVDSKSDNKSSKK